MPERLDKRVSHWGAVPRKRARQLVRQGRVTVDGEVVRNPAHPVHKHAITLDRAPLVAPINHAVFYKPVGVQCTVGDSMGRRSLQEAAADLLALGLHPVGRLDADTSGLLLFMRDGALTQRLLHPRHAVPKTYVATVQNLPSAELATHLHAGVATAMGVHTATDVHIDQDRVTLTVAEGKHRMVRRMLANTGHPVLTLHRERLGQVHLGDLHPGTWRPLSTHEAQWLRSLIV